MKSLIPTPRMALFGLVILGVLVFLALSGAGFYQMKILEKAHDAAVVEMMALREGTVPRPVLRGEALAGDGGPILDDVLGQYRHERSDDWRLLWTRVEEGVVPEQDTGRLQRLYESARSHLPDVREALQYESCTIRYGTDASGLGRDLRIAFRIHSLAAALLIEAGEHAGQGKAAEALRNITDAIQLGHDLARRPEWFFEYRFGIQIQDLSLKAAARLLTEFDLPAEPLEQCLREVQTLEASVPSHLLAMKMHQTGAIIEHYLILRGETTGIQADALKARSSLGRDLVLEGGWKLDEFQRLAQRGRDMTILPRAEYDKEYSKYRADMAGAAYLYGILPHPPGYRSKMMNSYARMACLRAALLVELYRARNGGAWPESLEGCAESLPTDPRSGNPARFRPAEGDLPPRVYLDGQNLVDDGGRSIVPFAGGERLRMDDFVVPLGPWSEGDPRR